MKQSANSGTAPSLNRPFFQSFVWLVLGCCVSTAWATGSVGFTNTEDPASAWVEQLREQGITSDQIMGFDSRGVPLLCGGSVKEDQMLKSSAAHSPAASALPSGMRSWATIPCVVRNNSTDTFRLEVNVNGAVSNVFLLLVQPSSIKTASGLATVQLRDDGLFEDRVAGDYVFTSELLGLDTNKTSGLTMYIHFNTNSPSGLQFIGMGAIRVDELSGTNSVFIVDSNIGILDPAILPVPRLQLSSNVLVSPHLINVCTSNDIAQSGMRTYSPIKKLFQPIYKILPDVFDFHFVFTTTHVESTTNRPVNFIAGQHWYVRVDESGIGWSAPMNQSAEYGSLGRLKGINLLDISERGIYSGNATHELVHQWGTYLDILGITDWSGHYSPNSSVGSLIGGFRWTNNAQGRFVIDCSEGRNGAYHAAALDKYLMGLISSNDLPVVRVGGPFSCGGLISQTNSTVTGADIVQAYGARLPGPATAQRNFSLGFVAETCNRSLTETEMTFYDILAAHYTKALPPTTPDPYVGFNWAPISRFFGEGTTWATFYNPSTTIPNILSASINSNIVVVQASGFPGEPYTLVSSTNLLDWNQGQVRNSTANGICTFTNQKAGVGAEFFRVLWKTNQ